MKRLLVILALLLTPALALAQFTTAQGGTGTTSPSGILFGDGTLHLKTVTIGSNLNFSGGTLSATGGVGTGLATTSPISAGNLLEYSSKGAGSAFGVATSSGTVSSPLTGNFVCVGSGCTLGIQAASGSQSGYLSAIDYGLLHTATTTFSSPLIYSLTTNAVTCQLASGSQAGCLSSTDWGTFNNKQAALTATWPQILTGATLTFGGLSTTTNLTQGQLPYVTGVNTFGQVATTTLVGGGPITVSNSPIVIGGSSAVLGCATCVLTSRNVNTAYPLGGGGALSGDLNLTFSGLATTSPWTAGQLAAVSNNNTVYSAATSSLGVTGPITFSGTIGNQVGGVGGNFGCTTASSGVAGCLSSTAFDIFNNKQALLGYTPWGGSAATTFGTTTLASTTPAWFQTALFASSTTNFPSIIDNLITTNATSTNATTTAFNANVLGVGASQNFTVTSSGVISKLNNNSVNISNATIQLGNSGGPVTIQNNVSTLGSTLKLSTTPVATADGSPIDAITFFVGTLEKARITGQGFLGIGTTSPTALLDLDTFPGASGATTTLFRIASSTSVGTTTLFQVNNVGIASTTNLIISGLGSGSTQCLQINGSGTVSGTGGSCAASFAYPFTTTTFGGTTVAATTTTMLFSGGFDTGSSTIGTLVATSSITNLGVKSALVLNSAAGLEGAYGGSSGVCTNQFPTSLSALGALGTCTSVSDAFFSGALGIAHGGTNATSFGNFFTPITFDGTRLVSTSSNPYYLDALVATSTSVSNTFASKVGVGTTSPFAKLSVNPLATDNNIWAFGVGSSTQTYLHTTAGGQTATCESKPATSTSATLNLQNSCNQIIWQIGYSATTLTLSGGLLGDTKRVIVCNPAVGTAGALTWAGPVEWAGGTIPTQTTTAAQCDVYSFIVTQATSTTGAVKYFGAGSTGFQ